MSMLLIAPVSRRRWIGLALAALACAVGPAGEAQESGAFGGGSWPRAIDAPGGRITIYEPQLETLRGNHLRARAAVSAVPAGASDTLFGGLWLDADLSTDGVRRTLTFLNVGVTDIRFPSLDARDAAGWRQAIGTAFQNWNLSFSLDTLLEDLRVLEARQAAAQQIKAEVPRILFRTHPAVLLTIDGEPSWRDLPGDAFRLLVNTPNFVVQEKATGVCFLNVDPFWWAAPNPAGPWQPLEQASGDVVALRRSELKAQDAAVKADAAPPRPEIVQAVPPAELIWTDGAPDYAPIRGTDLLYVRNTDSDVLLDIRSQLTYALLSGRWFRSADRVAWEFVPADQLPSDFGRIPPSSEKQHLLAFVAGTQEAQDAARNAEIPQTAAVQQGPASDLWVTYDGEPRFADAPDSPVRYADNSPYAVFDVNGHYYCCDDGVWYDSAYPAGPWLTCAWVPSVIYLLPPSCPYYYVTHCRIFGFTSGAIYFGCDPGYFGCYVWHGTPVFGTGWRYSGGCGRVWLSRPVTWGLGVRFHPRGSTWSVAPGRTGGVAWTGLTRTTAGLGTSVAVGVGGTPALGMSHRVEVPRATPSTTGAAVLNFYGRHPGRLAAAPILPANGVAAGAPPVPAPASDDRRLPQYHRLDTTDAAAPAQGKLLPGAPPPTLASPTPPVPTAGREPPPGAREHSPVPPLSSAPPRELPWRDPSAGFRDSGTSSKAPPTRDPREMPKRIPPPLPPVAEHWDPPRSPAPPPAPREYREPFRSPPPSPPPPPPPQNDRRDQSQDRSSGRR